MLEIAVDAVSSVRAARLIFDIAYPQHKARAPHIPIEVLAHLRELRALQELDIMILPTDDVHEAQRKYSLTIRIGHLEAQIGRAIEHIPLPMEQGDE